MITLYDYELSAYSGAVYVFQMPAAGWASATQTAEVSDSVLGKLKAIVTVSSGGKTIKTVTVTVPKAKKPKKKKK